MITSEKRKTDLWGNNIHNVQENFFEKTPESHTKWVLKCEFVPSGFMMRMMFFLMPGAFKKQSKKYMIDFKNFVEKGTSVSTK